MYQDMGTAEQYIAKFTAESDSDALIRVITKLFQDGYEDDTGVSYGEEGFVMPEWDDLNEEFEEMNRNSEFAVFYVKDLDNDDVIYAEGNQQEPYKVDWDKE